jgi:DNA-binding NarL/FixJ family response regulator
MTPVGTKRPVTVVLVDDECMFRASLRHLLTAPPAVIHDVYGVDVGPGFEVIGEAGNGLDGVSVVRSVSPDLLITDVAMPRMSGLDAIRELRAMADSTPTLVLTDSLDQMNLLTAVQSGVRGVVLKDSTTELLFEAIMSVTAGECWLNRSLVTALMNTMLTSVTTTAAPPVDPIGTLTPREHEVVALVVAGYANKEIAGKFAVCEATIKHHLTRIFDKLGASNRVELAMMASRRGLLEL